jgi:Cu2+-exporting ATPase
MMPQEHRHEHTPQNSEPAEHAPKHRAQAEHSSSSEAVSYEKPEHRGKQDAGIHQGHTDHSGGHGRHAGHSVEDFRRRFWVSLALTVPILVLSPMIQHFIGVGDSWRFAGDQYILFALSSFVYFFGGYAFLKGFVDELRDHKPGMMTLIAIAITTAYVYSAATVFWFPGDNFFWELATLIDVMLLGHWIEMKSVLGASRALEELARLMPSEAHRINTDGSVMDVPLNQLQAGDRVLIKPGEKIPADGEVVDGQSSVNESMLTGESVPVTKKKGSMVIGGSINGEGSLTVVVQKTGSDSFLSQVIDLVRQAQESKSKTQDLANRAAAILTWVALGGGALTLAAWLLLSDESFNFAIERTVTVMVIACPHALGLAVPLVVAVSTAIAAGNGLLIRDRSAFEAARNLQAIIFDKTGTLTEGRFGVTDTLKFGDGLSEEQFLQYAASVEAHSEHPIARGIVASVTELLLVDNFRAITGKGAEGIVDGHEIKVVSPGYLREHGMAIDDERIEQLAGQGKTVVFVVVDGKPHGAIALADIIRPESKQAIAQLKEMGIRSILLTGDNQRVAQWVASETGVDEVFAEVLPDQKAAKVREIQSRRFIVAMTGDGVNDAPALAQADVGIAIGAGTDVAVETADIVLVRSNPLDVVAIIRLSQATYRKMIQNLWWAAGYNIVAMPLAAGVLYWAGIMLSPAVGAMLMSLSTVIVAINARMLKV